MTRLTHASPKELDLDESRIKQLETRIRQWTDGPDAPIPGAAIVIGRHGKILKPIFAGNQGPEKDAEPIRKDGMFLLASITKPIVYMSALKLVEQGMLNLTERVTTYIPDFAAHHKDKIEVQNLFTHTSGLPDMLDNNVELRKANAPLSEFIHGAIYDTIPKFDHGTKVSYQSMGTLTVAEIVQRLSGQSIHDFVRDEIIKPLGLKSTGLGSKGFKRERLVRVETPDYQGMSNFGWNSLYWQELGVPWGGMFSSAEDMAVIAQWMMDYGHGNGNQILSPQMVQMATTNRLDDYPDLPESYRRCEPWGLGWRMNHTGQRDTWGDLLDQNVFGHTGATGTTIWMDRERDGFCVLLTTAIRSKAPWRLIQLSNIVASSFR